ncbi:hypothetical protein FHX08_001792 [Rhizobium sp. BK529]|uniref:hypothetical protein n=1 Tax=unclassified Rhizobium TaxID=2613769 RepID=UPI00104C1484|nr:MULTISPECIES: hypothetical protein [unclassified Rhizobium]MBB3591448.1 hypothetical protein [Rhizobium sp. BK529]TCS08601.1 hypothetical protein EV281_101470 [Rhizobium sp. BK418]
MAIKLNAGFTGRPENKPEGIRKAASNTASAVRREVQAVATGAADHPHTASSVVVGIGVLAFGIGYLLGRQSVDTRRFWR